MANGNTGSDIRTDIANSGQEDLNSVNNYFNPFEQKLTFGTGDEDFKADKHATYNSKLVRPSDAGVDVFNIDRYDLNQLKDNDIKLSKLRDWRQELADKQTWYGDTGKALLTLPGGLMTGIAENVGYIFEAGELFGWGDGNFENWLTKGAQDSREWYVDNVSGRNYLNNPSKTWDVTDFTWWANHAEGLLESVGEFAVTGFGVGSGLSKSVEVASKAAAVSAALTGKGTSLAGKVARAGKFGAQVTNAATLAFVEGAMSGGMVYNDVLQHQIDAGASPEEAKQRATQAARSTAQMNTIVNTFLNFGAAKHFFNKNDQYTEILGREAAEKMKAAASKGGSQALEEIKDINYTPLTRKQKLGELTKEGFKEGTEELVNLVSEEAGKEYGYMGNDKFNERTTEGLASVIAQFEMFGRNLDEVFSSEGMLSFALGVAGGVGQQGLVANIPLHKTPEKYYDKETGKTDYVRDASGNIKKTRKSSAAQENQEKEVRFNQAKANVIADLEYINKRTNQLKDLAKEKELKPAESIDRQMDDIKEELFNFQAYKSLQSGTADFLLGSFQKIASLDNGKTIDSSYKQAITRLDSRIKELNQLANDEQDPIEQERILAQMNELSENKVKLEDALKKEGNMTEAMKAGYATSTNDNEYKEKAKEAIDKLKYYEKLYKEVQDSFNYGTEDAADLAQHAFNLKVKADSNRRIVERQKKDIQEYKGDLDRMAEIITADSSEMQLLKDLVEVQSKIDGIKRSFGQNTLSKALASDKESIEYKSAIRKLMHKYPDIVQKSFKDGSTVESLEQKLINKHAESIDRGAKKLYEGKLSSLIQKRDELMGTELENSGINVDMFKKMLEGSEEAYDKRYAQLVEAKEHLAKNEQTVAENDAETAEMEEEYKRLQNFKEREKWIKDSVAYRKSFQDMISEKVDNKLNADKKTDDTLKDDTKTEGTEEEEQKKEDNSKNQDEDEGSDTEGDEDNKGEKDNPEDKPKPEIPIFSERYSNIESTSELHRVAISKLFDKLIANQGPDGYNPAEITAIFNSFIEEINSEMSNELTPELVQQLKESIGLYGMEEVLHILGNQGTKIKILENVDKLGLKNIPDFSAIYSVKGDTDAGTIFLIKNNRQGKLVHSNFDFLRENIMHESIHAFMHNNYNNQIYEDVKNLIFGLSDDKANGNYREMLDSLRNQVIDNELVRRSIEYIGETYDRLLEKHGEEFAMRKSVEEFITQAFTEKSFAHWLATIPSTDPATQQQVTIWDRFVKIIKDVIKDFVPNSKLDELVNIMNKGIIIEGATQLATYEETVYYNNLASTVLFTANPNILQSVRKEAMNSKLPTNMINSIVDLIEDRMKRINNVQGNKIVEEAKKDIDNFKGRPDTFHKVINKLKSSGLVSKEQLEEVRNYALKIAEDTVLEAISKGDMDSLPFLMMNKQSDDMFSEFEILAETAFYRVINYYKKQIEDAGNEASLLTLKKAFNDEFKTVRDKLDAELKTAEDNNEPVDYIPLLKYYNNVSFAAMNELDSLVVEKLSDDNFTKKHLVQLKQLGNNGDIKHNNYLYEVLEYNDDTKMYNLVQLDGNGNRTNTELVVPTNEVYDFQNNKVAYKDFGPKQELFEDDYILSMYMHNLIKENETDGENSVPDTSWIEMFINTFIDEISGENVPEAKITAAKFRFANNFFPASGKKTGARATAFKIASAILKVKGKVSPQSIVEMVSELHSISQNKSNTVIHLDRVRKFVIDSFKNKEAIMPKIRFRVNKSVSVTANQALEKELVSDNQIPKDKMRVGLMHAKFTRKTDGSDFIAIHNQMNIDISLEVELELNGEKKWISIGHPRNPRAYHRVSGDETYSEYYNPASVLREYNEAETEEEKGKILAEFNSLYSLKGEPITSSQLYVMGKSFEHQTKFFEMMESVYDKAQTSEDVVINATDLSDIMEISATSGSLDFNPKIDPDNPVTIKNLTDTSPEFTNIIESREGFLANMFGGGKTTFKPLVIDTISTDKELSYVKAYNILGGITTEELRAAGFDQGIDDLTALIPKDIKSRYWMIVKDLNGNPRIIPLKARKTTTEEIQTLTTTMLKEIENFNTSKAEMASKEQHDTLNKTLTRLFMDKIYMGFPHDLIEADERGLAKIKINVAAKRHWNDKENRFEGPVTHLEISIDAMYPGQEKYTTDEKGKRTKLSKYPANSKNRIDIPIRELLTYEQFMGEVTKHKLTFQGKEFFLNETNFRLQLPTLTTLNGHMDDLVTNVKSTLYKDHRLKSTFGTNPDFNATQNKVLEKLGRPQQNEIEDKEEVTINAMELFKDKFNANNIIKEIYPAVIEIMDKAISEGKFLTVKELKRQLNISENQAKKLMNKMVEDGIIQKGKSPQQNKFITRLGEGVKKGESALTNLSGSETDENKINAILKAEQEIQRIQAIIDNKETDLHFIIVNNFRPVDPISAAKETGGKVGTNADINPANTKKGGPTVQSIAEDIFYAAENVVPGLYTEQQIMDELVEFLKWPSKKAYITNYLGGDIKTIEQQIIDIVNALPEDIDESILTPDETVDEEEVIEGSDYSGGLASIINAIYKTPKNYGEFNEAVEEIYQIQFVDWDFEISEKYQDELNTVINNRLVNPKQDIQPIIEALSIFENEEIAIQPGVKEFIEKLQSLIDKDSIQGSKPKFTNEELVERSRRINGCK